MYILHQHLIPHEKNHSSHDKYLAQIIPNNSIYLELIILLISGELLFLQDYKLSLYLTNVQLMEIKKYFKNKFYCRSGL